MSSPFEFPSPIGGVPFDSDFGPSVLFAALYAVVCLVGFWRAAFKSTRTLLVITTLIFTIERTVIWSLRAKQAKTPSEDFSRNLTSYWQLSFGSGYIAIFGKLVAALKPLVLAAIKDAAPAPFVLAPADFARGSPGLDPYADPEASASLLHDSLQRTPYAAVPGDEAKAEAREADPAAARKRKTFTRIFTALSLQSLAPVALGIVVGYLYVDAETSASKVNLVRPLRYVVTLMCLGLLLALLGMCGWAYRMPRMRRVPLLLVVGLTLVLTVVPVYQLFILGNETTTLISTAPGSGNTPAEKAAFYAFQAVPELLTSGTLMAINAKEVFGM
ncbi:hypothetical protein PsYK624_111070 [Phanerochaete sordida]|uniref:Uncharacterized protein n=1 Tax=Phanerochaete sordida TaxID=48140 RepID=A0A9P3LGW1_9APHY|nr:hypothetical protein PsYK624_111070 [Phanerochaete sordida]